ncbi:MAG: hypothetical protein GYA51_12635, partial [Candidatus Methanofastidiosa archaeon]|nr:hypothetical protein [Candidatus Methanofastidiosa archaeon]
MKMTNLRNLLKSYGSRNIIGMYGIRDHGQFRGPRWTHDHSAACYSSSGKLDWYFELERLTDTKHDNKLEKHWRKTPLSILEESNDFLVGSVSSFAGSSFVARDGRLRIDCGLFSDNLTSPIIPARGSVSTDPLQTFPAWGIAQELAHPFAGVAFTGIPSLPALLVHADGGATVSSFSAFLWTENEIRCIESDWETVYQAMNFGFNDLYHEIFGQNDNERLATAGRLMGLASFAKDVDIEMINWLDENNWFRNHWVNPNKFFLSAKKMYGWQGKLQNWEDPFIQQLAGCAQYELQRKILFRLRRLAKKTGVRTLYAGGGIFLNVHLNRAIEREKLFDIFIVPPNTSDSGLGLGAACLLMWLRDNFIQPITPFIQFDTTNNKSLVVIPEIIEEVVDRIIQGQAFAIVSGAAEAGPRALGHRSIICLPTTEVANRISTEIKRREWYRPVAPVGLT